LEMKAEKKKITLSFTTYTLIMWEETKIEFSKSSKIC
jgi:hypothetical protein